MSVVAAGISAVGSIVGGMQAAKGQKAAAKLQKQQFAETKALLSPYTNAGGKALDIYGNAIGLNGAGVQKDFYDNFQFDPAYQKQLQAGTDAVTNSAAARGTLYGGNTLKAVNDFGGNHLANAYKTRLSQIGGVVDTGRQAASSLGTAGQNYANAAGGNLANAGMLQGQGTMGATNAASGGLMNYAQNQNYMTAMQGGSNFYS